MIFVFLPEFLSKILSKCLFLAILKLWEQAFRAEKQRISLLHGKNLFFERKDFMKFKVVGKNLILTDYSHKITEGENSFDAVEITVPRYHDDCDLSTLSFRFSEISENGESSAVQVLRHTKYDERYIYLKGSISSDFSGITGKVFFMLTGVSGENVVAKFQSTPYTINNDISLTSLPNETTAEQLFNQTQLEVQKAIDAANRAEKASQTPAPAEIYPAEEEKLGGVLSGNDISVDNNGTVTVNSVKGKTLGKSVPADAVFTDTVYTLPKAATGTLGGVKVDGKTITVSEDGTISASDSGTLKNEIAELKSLIGFTDNDIIGLHADFENSVFTRLGAAAGKNAGVDFDVFPMYGGRKRCNVLDNGTISAYYGDDNFAENGSNGQVMVYQPKFYYKVVPLKLDPQTDGYGYHLRSANYYISATPKAGFKLHPAFYDENGNPTNYILFSAYEGSIYDISADAYLVNDEQAADFSSDKLSSVAGVKPCSGNTQNLTRSNAEQLAKNRGKGWHGITIKAESANQILMIIEFASFNMQKSIGNGNVSANSPMVTGKTSTFGNSSGMTNEKAVTYRGMENSWGNMWEFVQGLNIYGDGKKKGGIPYICSNFNFSENKTNDNYSCTGFTLANTSGFISAFGYSEEYDWLFLASESAGNSDSPIGDFQYIASNLNGCKTALLSGYWQDDLRAGAFCFSLSNYDSFRYFQICSRLIYVPASAV